MTPPDVGGAAASGWTSYAPSEQQSGLQHHPLRAVGVGHSAFSSTVLASIAGAFNYITTIVNMRCPGMTIFRLPLAVWSLFVTAVLLLAGGAGAIGGGRRCSGST